MNWFNILSDAPDAEALVVALEAIGRNGNVAVFPEPDHCADEPFPKGYLTAAINLTWRRRGGRFGLDMEIGGAAFAEGLATVSFARDLARATGRAYLFSDCSVYGFSYFMAAPDGAIFYVWLVPNDIDAYDLDPDVLEWPLIVGPDAPLPPTADALPDGLRPQGCDIGDPLRCISFWTETCPRRGRPQPIYRDAATRR